jgi:hypothetical protein
VFNREKLKAIDQKLIKKIYQNVFQIHIFDPLDHNNKKAFISKILAAK